MLLLAQNNREVIRLETSDGTIEVRVTRVDGDEARIGIDVPQSVRIIRQALEQPVDVCLSEQPAAQVAEPPMDVDAAAQPIECVPVDAVDDPPPEAEPSAVAVADEDHLDIGEEVIADGGDDPWWLHPSEQARDQTDADPNEDNVPAVAMGGATPAVWDDELLY